MGTNEWDEWLRVARRAMLASDPDPSGLSCSWTRRRPARRSCHCTLTPREDKGRTKVPPNHGVNAALLASMNVEGIGSFLVVEGATITLDGLRGLREAATRAELAYLAGRDGRPGGPKKGERVRKLIGSRGCQFLYPPDLNPIQGPSQFALQASHIAARDFQTTATTQ